MENLRNRIDVRLVSNKKDELKWTLKPSYMSQKIFDNNLVAIHKSKVTLKLNKLAYVGMCILDLSKVLMYKFHFDYIKNKYGNSSKLLFTDTDSMRYEIKTEYFYQDFSKDTELFGFSTYSAKSKYYETGSVTVEEFAGLKPKIYSLLVDDSSEYKKAKGVNKSCCWKSKQ